MEELSRSLSGGLSQSLLSPTKSASEASRIVPADGKAYVSGDRSVPLKRVTIPQLLAEAVRLHGPREAAVFSEIGKCYSYYDLVREVAALAAGLLALGIEKGDRGGIWAPNRFEWVITQFATARIGAILVNINPAYRTAELEYVLNKVACKALVTAARFRSSDYLAMLRELAPEVDHCEPGRLHAARLPHLRHVIRMGDEQTAGTHNYTTVAALGGPAQFKRLEGITAGLDPDDAINIQFTSGTTGAPKGATLTHYNIVNNGAFVTAAMRFIERDRLCIPVPLYHCFGMVMGTLGCVSKGAAMIFPGEAFEAGTVLAAITRERCTALYCVPTMFVAMLDHPDFRSFDFSDLRTGIMAGAPCPIDVMKRVIADMRMREVTIAYGMTETSPVSFQTAPDDPLERRMATVGRIHPHVEVKVIGPEGQTLPVGESGELCTRGYSVMRGYWEDAERTTEAIDAGGWMHTGDVATIDAEGYETCARVAGRCAVFLILSTRTMD